MRSAGERRIEAAYRDVEAIHRLSNLLGGPPCRTLEAVAACGLRDAALRAEQALAFADGRKPDEVRRRSQTLAALPAPADLVESFDQWERLVLLNAVAYVMVYGPKVYGDAKTQPEMYDVVAVDEALRTINRWYDRFSQALRHKPGDKGPTINDLEDEFSAKLRRMRERKDTFFLFRQPLPAHPRGPKAGQGEAYAEAMMASMLPAFTTFQVPKLRSIAFGRQTALAYALAAYKVDHGKYPDELRATALGVPPETLLDPFYVNKPFAYRVDNGKRSLTGYEPPAPKKSRTGKPLGRRFQHVLELP
jgi:hypothetical protein